LSIKFSLSCGNSEKEFVKVVAMGIATCRVLESLGFATEILATEIVAGSQRDGRTDWFGSVFPLKKSGERFDPQKISVVSYPGFLRDFSFVAADVAQEGGGVRGVGKGNGYGCCYEYPDELLDVLGCQASLEISWARNESSQKEFLRSVLEKIEVA
jgi:hypothetical protein